MAYDLHIERSGGTAQPPISLPEWSAAVAETEGVRPASGEAQTATNPKTGEVISIAARAGDAEVFFPDNGEWHSVFRWRGKSAVFNGRFKPGDASHPVWSVAVALASRLGAVICGDEGEVYDLKTGAVIDE